MPESPEVEVLAQFLATETVGRRIVRLELEEFRVLKTRDRRVEELEGRTVSAVRRHGKHIEIATDGPALVVSFGRAGWLRVETSGLSDDSGHAVSSTAADPVPAPVARLVLETGDGGDEAFVLTDAGAWLSLGLSIVDEASAVGAIAKLGPDPLAGELSRADLDRIVSGRRKQLKALLQEQESLAGIGNAYSDEILHVARLSPLVHASDLGDAEHRRLFEAVLGVLKGALDAREGVPIDQLKSAKVASMRVHGRTGEPCPECGGLVEDVPGSKGTAQYCPSCQTAP